MTNHSDYIKEKLEQSGVSAPEHMDGEYVMDKIAGVQPKPVEVTGKKKKTGLRIAALAASFVVVAGAATGVAAHLHSRAVAVPEVSKNIGLVQFSSYDQVRTALKEIEDRNRTLYGGDEEYFFTSDSAVLAEGASGSASGSSGAKGSSNTAAAPADGSMMGGTSSDSHSDTYKQVEGVDEADIIKTDGRYIYAVEWSYSYDDYIYRNYVDIFPAVPGTTEPVLRIIPGQTGLKADIPYEATADEATPDEEPAEETAEDYDYHSVDVNDMFVKDGRLIIIAGEYTNYWENDYYVYEEYTHAYVYDVTDMSDVTLLDTYTQSGYYTSSRMIGDVLYLITNEYSGSAIPVCGRGSTPDEIPADCIYSVEKPSESTFLIISAYNTADFDAETQSKAILGVAEEVYCNQENLYITATDWNYEVYEDVYDGDDIVTDSFFYGYSRGNVTTKIFKVSLTGGIAFTAYGEVEGYIDSRYSLDEYNGNLRVATTSTNEDYEDINNLFVLDSGLNQIGSVTGFAETESIKAVRYVGDTAYVITYEQTDPLFVIDLSSPSSPTILGEVKISGFSTMLVPIDENTILGLGVNTGEYDYTDLEVQDGFKIALFDVSDKSNPKVLDSRSYVEYYSEVQYNPKALVYNPERGDFVIPMNYSHYEYDDDYNYVDSEVKGGILNFRVENGRIVETDLYMRRFTEYQGVGRCVYVGDTVYMTYTANEGKVFLDSVSYK